MANRPLPPSAYPPRYETFGPLDQGFAGWAFDPAVAASNTALGSSSINGARVKAAESRTITNLWAHVGVAGSGLTKVVMGIYDASGNKLGQSSDQSSAFASVGSKACPLTSGVDVTAGLLYYLLFLQVGTTAASIARSWSSSGNNSGNAGITAAPFRFPSLGSGFSDMPASFTPGSAAAANVSWWFGMS